MLQEPLSGGPFNLGYDPFQRFLGIFQVSKLMLQKSLRSSGAGIPLLRPH